MKTSAVLTETVEDGDNFDRGFNIYKQDSGPYHRSLDYMAIRNKNLMANQTPSGSRCYREYDSTDTTNQS